MSFHFGIEINSHQFLNINGSIGVHCFKWTLRRFWKPEYWRIDWDYLLDKPELDS